MFRKRQILKCDVNKVVLQHYWNHISAWVFFCKFAAYFRNSTLQEHFWRAASVDISSSYLYHMFFLVAVLKYICVRLILNLLKNSAKFTLESQISVPLCFLAFEIFYTKDIFFLTLHLLVLSEFTLNNIRWQHIFQWAKFALALLLRDDLCITYWGV